jgi:hypothetical protein
MEYTIIGITFGLCLFILPLWAYRRGLKDGLSLNKGQTIAPIQTPVQAYTAHVERKAEVKKANEVEDKITDGLANLMAYDGTPQKAKEGEK